MMCNFFSIGHGEGPHDHDGVGVVLKRFFKKSQLDVNGPKLQNVEDVVSLLRTHLFSQLETFTQGKGNL
jgi:hypothetical protein